MVACGGLITSCGLTIYIFVVGQLLMRAGVPPADWFGSDYIDPRGEAVSLCGELVLLGLLYFACGRVLNRRWGFATGVWALCFSSPLSVAIGYLSVWYGIDDCGFVRAEFILGFPWLFLEGWPILWHTTVLGFRQEGWSKPLVRTLAYAASLLAIALVRAHRSGWLQ